jgi:hypothetical protein
MDTPLLCDLCGAVAHYHVEDVGYCPAHRKEAILATWRITQEYDRTIGREIAEMTRRINRAERSAQFDKRRGATRVW